MLFRTATDLRKDDKATPHMSLKSTRQVMEESNRVGVQFLLADIAAALTFLNVAEVTQSESSRKRNCGNALRAYQTVLRLRLKVAPSEAEQSELTKRLEELKNRLEAFGILSKPETPDRSET